MFNKNKKRILEMKNKFFFSFFQNYFLKKTFKNSAEGVLIINKYGFIVWANKSVKDKNNVEGKKIAEIIGSHTWPPKINQPIRRQVNNILVEYIVTPLSGAYLVTIRELNGADGIVSEMEKKNVRQTGQVIHDLKVPLNAVLGFTGLSIESLEKGEYQEVKEYLQHIARAGDTILKDIESYLAFARLQNGVGEIKKEKINLEKMAEDAKKIIETGFRRHNIIVDIYSNNTIIEGDYSLIKNAIINALKNAAEETPNDGHIDLKIIETKYLVNIIIINSGHIPEENLKKIFRSTFSTKNGNGMGTQMIRMVAEAHNGNATIKNIEETVVLTITIPKV